MRKVSADYIFDGKEFVEDKVLIFTDQKIIDLVDKEGIEVDQHFSGILCPGFINTHCHLELSHLKGRVPTGTGLLPFLQKVVQFRDVDQHVIDESIEDADQEMWDSGIDAVGDISNQADTISTKKKSKIYYHTFVEMFDFMQKSLTDSMFDNYRKVYDAFVLEQLSVSATPHAPYTVSPGLFAKIDLLNPEQIVTSIHNQETDHENLYFKDKTGGFSSFFTSFQFDDSHFQPIGHSSIHYTLENMRNDQPILLIHNTQSKIEDIQLVKSERQNTTWVTCANANLYIENQLPDYESWLEEEIQIAIGTDSLSSNWQLSIWQEICTISKLNNYIPLSIFLKWACHNGAKALQIDDRYGGFFPTANSGVLLIENASPDNYYRCNIKRLK